MTAEVIQLFSYPRKESGDSQLKCPKKLGETSDFVKSFFYLATLEFLLKSKKLDTGEFKDECHALSDGDENDAKHEKRKAILKIINRVTADRIFHDLANIPCLAEPRFEAENGILHELILTIDEIRRENDKNRQRKVFSDFVGKFRNYVVGILKDEHSVICAKPGASGKLKELHKKGKLYLKNIVEVLQPGNNPIASSEKMEFFVEQDEKKRTEQILEFLEFLMGQFTSPISANSK